MDARAKHTHKNGPVDYRRDCGQSPLPGAGGASEGRGRGEDEAMTICKETVKYQEIYGRPRWPCHIPAKGKIDGVPLCGIHLRSRNIQKGN